MRILSIETSCDETAISIIEARDGYKNAKFKVLANNIASQVNVHRQYGGVFPMLAKREHSKNLIPLLKKTLKESGFCKLKVKSEKLKVESKIKNILEREPELLEQFLKFIPTIKKPKIDAIAVTHGPGLEPALWVGVNFAKALSLVWDIQIIPVNHMLGHFFSILVPDSATKRFSRSSGRVASEVPAMRGQTKLAQPDTQKSFGSSILRFPTLALLVSGGHTELVLSKNFMKFKKIGETRDDAAGECFDKVARLLGLPYPGGPEISKLAAACRKNQELVGAPQGDGPRTEQFSSKKIAYPENLGFSVKLPRPMLNSPDFDFSYSGLKTAVLYLVQKLGNPPAPDAGGRAGLTPKLKQEIAREFEDAAVEVLVSKTLRAAQKYEVKTIIVAGGVAANQHLRQTFKQKLYKLDGFKNLQLLFPARELATDNSLMIALAGYFQYLKNKKAVKNITAQGNLKLR